MSSDNYNEKLIAHELGHCLNLHHPFGSENKIEYERFQRESDDINNTDNLMDYNKIQMHTLWLWQWIIMNNHIKYYKNE